MSQTGFPNQPGVPGGAPAMPPRVVVAVGLVVAAAIAWFLLQMYTSGAVRECRALYRAARTAADTALVDRTVPPSGEGHQTPNSCGFIRYSARWQ